MGSTRSFAKFKIALGNELVGLLEVILVVIGCPRILLLGQQTWVQKSK